MSTPFLSSRWPLPLVCGAAVLALALGYLAARQLSGGNDGRASTAASAAARQAATGAWSAIAGSDAPWDARWNDLFRQPASPARDRALAALLEELARTDPRRAIDIAAGQTNWGLRQELRNAALRGWGAVAPDAAADWSMQLRLEERMFCVAAVLQGAAERPDEAIRVGLRLCAADPGPAGDYGHALVSALIQNGDFAAASRFAAEAKMVDRQSFLLDSAFYQWAQHQPDKALSALGQVSDSNARDSIRQGVLQGWAEVDAKSMSEYAMRMPPGDDRTKALGISLPAWVERDPAAATQWINSCDPTPELDEGLAAIAVRPALVQTQPTAAMDWADSISDTAKRIMTKHDVFMEWAKRDYAEAERYFNETHDPDERDMMTECLRYAKLIQEPAK